MEKCSVPMRYQSHDEFFSICAILTVRGLACSKHCLKVTNLSRIAVFSIHQSLTSLHRTYKIAVRFIWKILPYLSCRFDHITKGERMIASCQHRCVSQKWKFNVFVTMGRVFQLASCWSRDRFSVFCARHTCRLRLETNSTKTLFPGSTLRTVYVKKRAQKVKQDEKFLQFRHVWRLHV